jgi:hypothetical protein
MERNIKTSQLLTHTSQKHKMKDGKLEVIKTQLQEHEKHKQKFKLGLIKLQEHEKIDQSFKSVKKDQNLKNMKTIISRERKKDQNFTSMNKRIYIFKNSNR